MRIAAQAAQGVADRLSQEKRTFESLDETEDEQGLTLLEGIEDLSNPSEIDFLYRLTISRATKKLPPELQIILEAALEAEGELAEAQRALGLSTSEFYRRLRELRYRLVMLGLAPRRMVAGL